MTRRAAPLLAALLLIGTDLVAQERVDLNAAVLFETYEFDSGLDFGSVSQLSVPVTASADFGRLGALTLSSGLTSIRLSSPESATGEGSRSLSGLVDTEARFVVDLVQDRFSLLATAVIPTGIEALDVGEGPILTALSSQVIGFSTTSLGAGGAAGAGFAGALPVGEMAVGLSGSYTHSMSYTPVLGQPNEWKPGDEFRIRAGLEGPVAHDTYLRIASIFASRQKDRLDDEERGGVGNRIHGYVALNHRFGANAVTVYAFDSYRSGPQVEATAIGPVIVPKGNLLALGAKVAVPVSRETRLIPRLEYRRLSEAPREDAGDGALESAGSTVRIGADLRQPLSPHLAVVLEATGLFGQVGNLQGGEVGVSGFRLGVHLEASR